VEPPNVIVELSGVVWIARLTGEHDITMAPYVRRQLESIPEDATGIVVDLSETSFLDSAVLAELIHARRRVESAEGGRFAVVVPRGGPAAALFDLVDADRRFFLTFESQTAAVTSLQEDALPRQTPPA
jgi:anti-anti-sigma factor